MPGDARAHLAPHDRHPQLITDHGPHRSPGRASGRGWGSGPGWDSGGSGPGGGSGRGGRGWSNGPGEGFWPGTGNRWPGAVRADRHGVARVGRHGTDIAGDSAARSRSATPSRQLCPCRAFCTSDPQAYAHSRSAALVPGLAASGRSAPGACVTRPGRRRQGPGADEIAQEGTDASAALQEKQPVYRPPACDHAHPDPVRTASRGPPERPAGHCPACVTTATTWNATRWPHRPPGSAAAQRPGPYPVMTADRSRWRIPAVARRAVAVLAKPSRPGRIRKAPPRMRWRGLARPRRTGWLVARPCWHSAPPAGARYPCKGPVSRLLPRSRGRPRVMPVSER